jgi:hypothetical protein
MFYIPGEMGRPGELNLGDELKAFLEEHSARV